MAERFFLEEVTGDNLEREFINFPDLLFKKEKRRIRPLDDELIRIFDSKRNKLFRNGEAVRWLLKNESSKTVGRIAAFYNKNTAKKH